MKDFGSAKNMIVALVMFTVMFLAGCGTNLTEQATQNTNKYEEATEQATQNTNRYKEAIDNTKQTSALVELKQAQSAQEAYHSEYGTYTSNINDLRQYGDIPEGLTILEASESTFRLKIERNGQTYFYPKE